jgi:hypothetical protein
MWSVTTPRAILPDRRIGRLREGYEASFLVPGGDPLADFGNTRRIVRRVKQGVPIELGTRRERPRVRGQRSASRFAHPSSAMEWCALQS